MSYLDGFVVPVSKKKLPAYRRMARKAGKIRAGMAHSNMANASSMA